MATQAQISAQARGRSFYVAMAVISAAIVFAGFSRTFFFNSYFAKRDLTSLMIFHGIIFSCWLVLLITQTSLVAANRTDIHRKLGVVGAILAALMIVVGFTLAIHAAKYGFKTPGLPPPLIFLVVPFFDILIFAVLVGAALYHRGKPDTHKRLMLVATISILPPAFARLPFHFISATLPFSAFILGDVVLVGCILWDVAIHRRLHRAFLWGGLIFFLSFPVRMAIASTTTWLAFARWLTS